MRNIFSAEHGVYVASSAPQYHTDDGPPCRSASSRVRFVGIAWRARPVVNAFTGFGFIFTSDAIKARLLRPVIVFLLRFFARGKIRRIGGKSR